MNLLIDAIIIAIGLTCVIWGYKSGLVKMAVNFLKNIIALILASIFASKLGGLLYDLVFKGVFENFTMNKIASWLGVEPGSGIDIGPLLENNNSEFLSFIEKLGLDIDKVAEKYSNLGENTGDLMVEYIAKPLGMTVSNVVSFILIFTVAILVISLVGFIVDKIVKLPVLNVTNRILGLVLGALLGVIFVFIFVALLNAVVPYIRIDGEHISAGALEEGTIIYKYFVHQTPAGLVNDILEKIGVRYEHF